MPESCACFNCTNKRKKSSGISFHRFPDDAEVRKQWLKNVRRKEFTPTKHHRVCSDHFVAEDYLRGVHPRDAKEHDIRKFELKALAVPTIFPGHPPHRQVLPRPTSRPPPKQHSLPFPVTSQVNSQKKTKRKPRVEAVVHSYSKTFTMEERLTNMEDKLKKVQNELRVSKQNVKRKTKSISKLLTELHEKNLLIQHQASLLSHS